MKMQPKMLLGSSAMSVAAVLFTTLGVVAVANKMATSVLQEQVTNRLVVQRDIQKDKVENFFKGLFSDVTETTSQNSIFVDAFSEFNPAFSKYNQQVKSSAKRNKLHIEKFYNEEFVSQFKNKNKEELPALTVNFVEKMNNNAIALQDAFIASNPNELGNKLALDELSGNKSEYSKIHKKFHPALREYLLKKGFYDLFLIDAKSGNILYTVYKELDFATSLQGGPFADSGLGEVYRKALKATKEGQVFFSDLKPYMPSYNDNAAFLSAPIFKNGELEGVVAIQIPVQLLNQTMTVDSRWKQNGLGKTGETFLVGSDFKLRTEKRQIIENYKGLISDLKKSDIPKETFAKIAKTDSVIGLLKIQSANTMDALNGNSGSGVYSDFRSKEVLSAYAPISVAGKHWAIMAEMDAEEAFAPVYKLTKNVMLIATAIGVVVIAFSLLGSLVFVRNLIAPINHFKDIINRARGGEKNLRVKLASKDEVGELANAFDDLLDEREKTFTAYQSENNQLNESIINMLQVAAELAQGDLSAKMTVTEDVTGPLADSLNMVMQQTAEVLGKVMQTANAVGKASVKVRGQSETVKQVADNEFEVVKRAVSDLSSASVELNEIVEIAMRCNEAADETIASTDKAQQTVLDSVKGINNIRDNIRETEKRIKRLGERSQEVSSVVDIINGIAEKTHVLALNASMQAASAGEAGRGFAVVANEVQRLAENAREATSEISQLVKNIQVDTADTVTTMNKAITQVVEGTKMAEKAGAQMTETRAKSGELVELVQQIADRSTTQAGVAVKLQKQAGEIQNSSAQTSSQLEEQSVQTKQMVQYSAELIKAINAFKLPDEVTKKRAAGSNQ